ncbi:UD11 glucuronosyltransferase, partial [Nothocercus nigrocapillus]|nr:UD11 glucuronosyltransferase [Nothocercus nigrocapillus]
QLVVLLLLCGLPLAAGGKLLVVPVDGSHWLSMQEVLDVLGQKGHEIVIVAPEVSLRIKPSEHLNMKTYPVPFTKEEMHGHFSLLSQQAFEEGSLLERFIKRYKVIKRSSVLFLSICTHLLFNKELVRYLEESQFDAVFTDPFIPCGQILAEHLSVPSVFFLRGIPCGLEFEATQCPNPPSYVPRFFMGTTDHMTFLQRVKNLLLDFLNIFLCDFVYDPYAQLASEFLERDVSVPELLSHASIWLTRLDFAFEYPRPLMPNMIAIGGVNCASKKLSQ